MVGSLLGGLLMIDYSYASGGISILVHNIERNSVSQQDVS